jgi:hypothetical protein
MGQEAEDQNLDEGRCDRTPIATQAAAIQVLLAEKRTSLAVLRTGIAVAIVPLSITTVLVTLSRFYSWVENLHFLGPMYAILTGLVLLSGYLIGRAVLRIHHYDRMIAKIRQQNPAFSKLIG